MSASRFGKRQNTRIKIDTYLLAKIYVEFAPRRATESSGSACWSAARHASTHAAKHRPRSSMWPGWNAPPEGRPPRRRWFSYRTIMNKFVKYYKLNINHDYLRLMRSMISCGKEFSTTKDRTLLLLLAMLSSFVLIYSLPCSQKKKSSVKHMKFMCVNSSANLFEETHEYLMWFHMTSWCINYGL